MEPRERAACRTRMRWLAVAVVFAATGASAWAERPPFTMSAVGARLDGTTARLTARFSMDVRAGMGLDVAAIPIPTGAVVTGGTAIIGSARHPLRLVEAESAQRAFEGLAAKPLAREHAWALLVSSSSAAVSLNALAATEAKLTIELAVDMPTCFHRDARYALVPELWQQNVAAALRATADDALTTACAPSDTEGMKWLRFPSHQLGKQRIGMVAGVLAVEAGRLVRVEIDLAPRLADVPGDLATAIVIDQSRSMSASELETQRALVASYLQLAPASRVQVIAYARRAQALLPVWMTAAQAAARVDRAIRALAPANGSNLDVALHEAASWLARTHGTKRIVLVSDERLGDRFADIEKTLVPLVPASTLVHVVTPTGGTTTQRDDEGLLAGLAKPSEGVEVMAGDNPDATMLLRPTSLDHVEVKAPGWDTFGFGPMPDCAGLDKLAEGNACEWWAKTATTSGPITIEGLLWNHRVSRIVSPDASQARTLARMLAGANTLEGDLAKQVARAAQAVDSAWSLFGTWGGKGGYEDLGGYGTIGLGRIGTTSSHDVGTGTLGPPERPLELTKLLQPAIERCKPTNAKVTVTIETTLQEIVDVAAKLEPANDAIRDCITEAVWDTTLSVAAPPAHGTTVVRYP